jgi:WD40 repeat protein
VALGPDGRTVAVATGLGTELRFVLPDTDAPAVFGAAGGAVRAVAFAGSRLVSGGDDGVLRVWDGAGPAPTRTLAVGVPLVMLAAAPGGRYVVSGGVEGYLRLHDLEASGRDERLKWHAATITGLAWAGTTLVSGDAQGRLALWDLSDRLGAP